MDNSTDLSTYGGSEKYISENEEGEVRKNATELGSYYFYLDTNGATGGSVTVKDGYNTTSTISYDHETETGVGVGGNLFVTCNLEKKGYAFIGWQVTNNGCIYTYGLSSSNYNTVAVSNSSYGDFTYLTTDSLAYGIGDTIYFGYSVTGFVEEFALDEEDMSLSEQDNLFDDESTQDVKSTATGTPLFTALWEYNSIAEYDSSNDYWYFEDGYMPQSYYGSTAPSGVGECSSYYTLNITDSTWAKVSLYDVDEDSYAYVVMYSESGGEVASGWFNVEPIVWIVGYGSEVPTDFSTAVTAKIVTCGQMTSSAGANWSARRGLVVQSVQFFEFSTTFENAVETSWMYDSFSGSTSQIAVTDDAVSMSSLLTIASVEEIDALGGTYASTCTDFVAFLLSGGSSTDGDSYSADYWTRDLAASLDSDSTYGEYTSVVQLNNGVYVTKDGTLNNAKLSTLMGARLTMNV